MWISKHSLNCPFFKSTHALRSISFSLRYHPEEESLSGTDNRWALLSPTAIFKDRSEALGTRITFSRSEKLPYANPGLFTQTSAWLEGEERPTLLSPWEMKSTDENLQSVQAIYQFQIILRSSTDFLNKDDKTGWCRPTLLTMKIPIRTQKNFSLKH